jgi:hypothetical protein
MIAGATVCVAWTLAPGRPLGLDPIFAGVGASLVAFVGGARLARRPLVSEAG